MQEVTIFTQDGQAVQARGEVILDPEEQALIITGGGNTTVTFFWPFVKYFVKSDKRVDLDGVADEEN